MPRLIHKVVSCVQNCLELLTFSAMSVWGSTEASPYAPPFSIPCKPKHYTLHTDAPNTQKPRALRLYRLTLYFKAYTLIPVGRPMCSWTPTGYISSACARPDPIKNYLQNSLGSGR